MKLVTTTPRRHRRINRSTYLKAQLQMQFKQLGAENTLSFEEKQAFYRMAASNLRTNRI